MCEFSDDAPEEFKSTKGCGIPNNGDLWYKMVGADMYEYDGIEFKCDPGQRIVQSNVTPTLHVTDAGPGV